ncbi:MAG: hypothetical protein AB1640_08020 [bacterium]
MKNCFKALWISPVFVLLLLALAAAAETGEVERDAVKRYNRLLQEAFADAESANGTAREPQLKNLTELASQLLAADISDPSILQKLDFVASYEALFALNGKEAGDSGGLVSRWKELLMQLDVKAHEINNSPLHPFARWILRKSLSVSAEPTPRMIAGYIEREENLVRIGSEGQECSGCDKGCQKLRYVQLRFLVPGIPDPGKTMELLRSFPPEKANPRVTHYWEVLLDPASTLTRRSYRVRPFPGYSGPMEDYYQVVFRDDRRIVAVEQNARTGRFILRSDNAAVYLESPPHGVTVSFIFSGKYVMEKFFYVLAGNKLLDVPVEVMAILRQYVIHPELGVEHAVEAGRKDYRENQGTQ